MAEEQQLESAIEITTEFDRAISKLKWKIFRILAVCLFLFIGIEFVLIFFVFSDSNVLRTQSMNGAIVMAGGLTMVTITSLLLILPTKLIAYESLKLVRSSSKDMAGFVAKANPVVDKMDVLADKVDGQLSRFDQLSLDLKNESRMIREELARVSKAFSTKIESPVKRIVPSAVPKELANDVDSEARAKAAVQTGGNGHSA